MLQLLVLFSTGHHSVSTEDGKYASFAAELQERWTENKISDSGFLYMQV